MKSNAQEERRNPNDEKKIKLKKGRRNFEKIFQSSKNQKEPNEEKSNIYFF